MDVSDPKNPTELSHELTTTLAQAIAVNGHFAVDMYDPPGQSYDA
jgi:hypothetical protein